MICNPEPMLSAKLVTVMKTINLMLLLLFSSALIHAGEVQVYNRAPVVMVNYPPFTSPDIPGGGIFYEALEQALAEQCCWQIIPEFLPAMRAKEHINDTESDWLISFMPDRDGLKHVELYVLLEDGVNVTLFRRAEAGAFTWKNLSFLHGKSVAISRGLPADDVHKMVVNAGGHVVLVNNLEQGIRMLLSGRVDYVEGLYEAGFYQAVKAGFDPGVLQASEPPLFTLPARIYLNTLHPAADKLRPVLKSVLPVKR